MATKNTHPQAAEYNEESAPFFEEGSLDPDNEDDADDEDPLSKKKKKSVKKAKLEPEAPKEATVKAEGNEPRVETEKAKEKAAAKVAAADAALSAQAVADLATALKVLEKLPNRMVDAMEVAREERLEEGSARTASKLTLALATGAFVFSILSVGLAQSARRSALAGNEAVAREGRTTYTAAVTETKTPVSEARLAFLASKRIAAAKAAKAKAALAKPGELH